MTLTVSNSFASTDKQYNISVEEKINDATMTTVAKGGVFHHSLSGGTNSIELYKAMLWQVNEQCAL